MSDSNLPKRWPWLVRGFQRHVNRLVRRRFEAVRLSKSSALLPAGDSPLLFVMNHPSWWDPMIGSVVTQLLPPSCVHYAAIEAKQLTKYWVFRRLGFLGVEANSITGVRAFLGSGSAILGAKNRAFWVTAQGAFVDVRQRPLSIRSGVGHLAARCPEAVVIPIAVEYAFWNEQKPEALVRVGPSLTVAEHPNQNGKAWTVAIEAAMTASLDILNQEVMTRDQSLFTTLLDKKIKSVNTTVVRQTPTHREGAL